jgi:hypothetical protein
VSDPEFYRFARDFFGIGKARAVEKPETEPDPQPTEPNLLPEILAKKIKACLVHVRTVGWGDASADFEINDGAVRLLIRMSVTAIARADKSK